MKPFRSFLGKMSRCVGKMYDVSTCRRFDADI